MIESENIVFSENIVVPKNHCKNRVFRHAIFIGFCGSWLQRLFKSTMTKPSNPLSFHNFVLESCIDEIPWRGGCGGQLQ